MLDSTGRIPLVGEIQFIRKDKDADTDLRTSRELAVERPSQQQQQQQEERRAFAPVMTFDDVARIEPLVWSGAALSTTLSRGFAITEPAFDVGRFKQWATTRCATGKFLVNRLEPFVGTMCGMEARLSAEARRLIDEPNAGGNSAFSEALSFEALRVCFGARLQRTEMSIQYWLSTKITDYSIELCGETVGVSVSRACKFRGRFTVEDAEYILHKKLHGINESTKHVITPHAWRRQVLHLFVQRPAIADQLAWVYARLPLALRSDTLVLCTVVPKQHRFVFFG